MGFLFGRGKRGETEGEGSESTFLTGDEGRDQRSLRILLGTIADVSGTIELEALLVDIVDKSIEVTKAERGILLLFKRGGGGELEIRVARNDKQKDLPLPVLFSTSVAGKVAREATPLRSMVNSDREALELGQSVFDLKLRAVMCVPLVAKERVLGVIYVDSRAEKREFRKADLAFFAALSNQIAISLENARLHKDSLTKARMEKDLEIARQIQGHLIPEAPKGIPGFDIRGWYRPCQEATGDTYDFVPMEGERLAIMMGDVTGHGVGAALITHTAQASLRSYLELLSDPAEVVRRLNNRLVASLETGTFMSLFLGIIDIRKKTLSWVNAGHPGAWIVRDAKATELEKTAMALGILDGQEFGAAGPIELRAGDLLFLCTDGMLETRNPEGGFFGSERLAQKLVECRGCTAHEVLETVLKDGNEFRAGHEVEDDWTMLAVKMTEEG
jgi:sigma-B regulation protein RsbU (phosphoserine phosphatase)